jgi:hypothetical protein
VPKRKPNSLRLHYSITWLPNKAGSPTPTCGKLPYGALCKRYERFTTSWVYQGKIKRWLIFQDICCQKFCRSCNLFNSMLEPMTRPKLKFGLKPALQLQFAQLVSRGRSAPVWFGATLSAAKGDHRSSRTVRRPLATRGASLC